MLIPFGDDIWIFDGPEVVAAAGFHYPTRMAIIRLENGDLCIWSPVKLDDNLQRHVSSLGTVKHLIAPNSLHHVFLGEWKQAFPDALLYAPPGLRERRPDLVFSSDLTPSGQKVWSNEIDFVVVEGNLITTEVVFFHKKSGSVIFTDLLQHFPSGWFSGWRAVVAKLDLMTEREPAVPRKFRLAFSNRRLARNSINVVLEWPAKKVLIAHGAPVENDAIAFLKRAFRWL